MSPVDHLFVYGTLKRGEPNFRRYVAHALTVEPAVIRGRLYHLPQGYPGLRLDGHAVVHGEAMTFPDLQATLAAVDPLEDCDPARPECSLYRREIHTIHLQASGRPVRAWVYVLATSPPAGCLPVADGRWRSCRRVTEPGS